MAILFMDGFDKYGGANTNITSVAALMAGEWTTISNITIAAPLSATGQAMSTIGTVPTLLKTLSGNYGRIIGGVRFSSTLLTAGYVQFNDGGSNQCGIGLANTGILTVRNGSGLSGTILGSSAVSVSANSTHYLEWDITFGNSAAYNVYLDGVSVISGTGDTTATANNTISAVVLGNTSTASITFDDFYLFDSTGTTNNAVLLTSPRIETTFPVSDSAVQFTVGASVFGTTVPRSAGAFNTAANIWYVRPFTLTRACTLNSISLMGAGTTGSAISFRPTVYTDNAGVPGTLMTTGAVAVGITAGSVLTLPLTTPQVLTAGTQYWLGFMVDTAMVGNVLLYDASAAGRTAVVTFSSGAPGTAPASSGGQGTAMIWGNITLTAPVNFYEVNQQPPSSPPYSYLTDGTATHEDLYNFNALSAIPGLIYEVAVKALIARTDTGAKTVSMRTKSGATDSAGSLAGQSAPPATPIWLGSYFDTDPNTSGAWTGVNLNAATSGVRIDS